MSVLALLTDCLAELPPSRLTAALVLLIAWGGLCRVFWRRASASLAAPLKAATTADCLVVYASQSGLAEMLAHETAAQWAAGTPVVALDAVTPARLAEGGRVLFVVATAGDGEAPDNARRFARYLESAPLPALVGLQYALLALGDDRYPNYCAFAQQLEMAMQMAGAQALQPMIRVNRGDETAIARWMRGIAVLSGGDQQATGGKGEKLSNLQCMWRLVKREHLNPGSPGGEVYRLSWVPVEMPMPDWVAGDLVRVELPGWDGPRDYSLASLPSDGHLQLLIRRHVDFHGRPGVASNFLTMHLPLGGCVPFELRPHPSFHLAGNADRPLLLIGNGVGLAALLVHLKARIAAGRRDHWLIFGERSPHADHHGRDLIDAWLRLAALRFDAAFSRCERQARHVQDVLRDMADELIAWVDAGAAIYVCGSRQGMAAGVDDVLHAILGEGRMEVLAATGRYRRDVF